jgi:putative tryptophan/tyrosine transport system substrate-binding protein
MNPKLYWLLTAIFLVSIHPAEAQQPRKITRIGVIVSGGYEAFEQGLRDLGYIEGRNVLIERRYGEGNLNRMPIIVNELVKQQVDILFVTNQVAILAAKKSTQTIPIIMVSSVDPVMAGLVDSLSRPGGNITGLSQLSRNLSAKRVELLRETLPGISRLAILWDPEGPGPRVAYKEYQAAAQMVNVRVQSLEIRGPKPNIEGVCQGAKAKLADAVIIVANPLTTVYEQVIVEQAIKNRIPSMGEGGRIVRRGALMSYGSDITELYRRAATYVDKILKGTKPADLPVEQPTKFELVINLKTAKQIGLIIPPNVLARADRVIR